MNRKYRTTLLWTLTEIGQKYAPPVLEMYIILGLIKYAVAVALAECVRKMGPVLQLRVA